MSKIITFKKIIHHMLWLGILLLIMPISMHAQTQANNLSVTYPKASENIVVKFDLMGSSVNEELIPDLDATNPNDVASIAAKYGALKLALDSGISTDIETAALALGDDIITEYYYLNGSTEVFLKTAGGNNLIKNKYWEKYLINTASSTGYPNFGTSLFLVPAGSYITSTNPATSTVATGWLNAVYGKDLHVRVTVVSNGQVNVAKKTAFIAPVGPVDLYSDHFVTFISSHATIQSAVNAAVAGNYIKVASGTYAENISITKSLNIRGANYNVNPNDATWNPNSLRVAESTIVGSITSTKQGFSMNGFELKANSTTPMVSFYGAGTSGSISIANNIFSGEGQLTNALNNGSGIPFAIENNIFKNFKNGTGAKNFVLFFDGGSSTVSSIISGNYFLDNTRNGMIISGSFTNPQTISGNNFNQQATAIILGSGGHTISNNFFTNQDKGRGIYSVGGNNTITSNKFTNNNYAIWIATGSGDQVHNNIFLGGDIGGKSIYHHPTTNTLDATCNWWNTTVSSEIPAKFGGISPAAGLVNFLPYSTTADALTCDGVGPISVYDTDPLTTGVLQSSHMTIQAAIDAATTINGNFIKVSAGSYSENVTVNKSLTIRGANTGKNPNTVTRTAESRLLDGTMTIWGANTVVLDGFEVYQTDEATAITIAGESAVTLENTILNRQGAVEVNAGTAVKILAGTGIKTISANKFTGSYAASIGKPKSSWLVALDIEGATGNNIATSNNILEHSVTVLNINNMSTGITLDGNILRRSTTLMAFSGSAVPTDTFTFGANEYSTSFTTLVKLTNVDPSFRLDIKAGQLGNKLFNDFTLAELFNLENKIQHREKLAINTGLVYFRDKSIYITSLNIQGGINYAASGDFVYARNQASSYLEALIIDKSLTLIGANPDVLCGDTRSQEARIAPSSGVPITITADNVTVNGFEITAPRAFNAINLGASSNVVIKYNNIHDVGTNNVASGSNVHAILYTLGTANTSDVTIFNNCIDNIGRTSLSGYSASAIGIIQSTSSGVLDRLSIQYNTISNVKVSTAAWPAGKVAYGILTNVGGNSSYASNTGNVKNANISFNTISGLSGHIATGIALEGNTETAIVERNTVSNLTSTKTANRAGGGYDLNGLKFENNKYVNTVNVQNNSFDVGTSGYAVANYVPTAIGGVATLNCNWFGFNDYGVLEMNYNAATPVGKIFNKEGAGTTFIPYLSNAIIDPTEVGYTCSSSFAMPNTLDVTYTAASDNIVLNFELTNNSVAAYPIPGLNPATPADLNVIAAKYIALKDAIDMGTPESLKAAAFALGDDIITEYYYMDGTNKVYLKTAGNSDLIKSKYWDQYLVNSGTTERYPNFGSSLFIVPVGPYITSTNPLTGLVPNGWLVPVYGKDLYVRITVVNNGNVSVATKTVPIDAVPVSPAYSGTSIITSLEAATATASKADAYLNIVSNNLGVVITRINGTASVINPVEGMIIYDTSDNTFKVNTTGTVSGWRPFAN